MRIVGKITDCGPLAQHDGEITTQYTHDDLALLGLGTIYLLGHEVLTLQRNVLDAIRESSGPRLDLDALPLDDAETFALLARGDAEGVFLLDSPDLRDCLVRMRPDRMEDLLAAMAMFRPGPSRTIDTYIARKHGHETAWRPHPLVGAMLDETYGLVIYTEQVLSLAQRLADFSPDDAYLLRRALGKKGNGIMASYRAPFIAGATPKIGAEAATRLFAAIEDSAPYAVSKSHNIGFALITYQSAYLKAHFPADFAAAVSRR